MKRSAGAAGLAGLGVALAPAATDLSPSAGWYGWRTRNGKGEFAYYLVHPADKAELPPLQRFKSWLRAAL